MAEEIVLIDGFENNDLLSAWGTKVGDAAVSTASPRSGSRHLRCPLAAGATGSHYVQHQFNSSAPSPWGITSPLVDFGVAGGFDLSVNYQTDVNAGTQTNLQQIIRLGDSATWYVVMRSNMQSSARNLVLATPSTTATLLAGFSASTKYDIRIKAAFNSSGVGGVEAWVFTNGTGTLLGHVYLPLTISTDIDFIQVGAIPVIASTLFLEGAQNHDFDDIIVKRGVTLSSTTSDNGSGAVSYLAVNGAGASATCTPVGSGTNYQNVDNPVTDSDATKDADYNNTELGATLHKDFYALGSYAGGGTSKVVSLHMRHLQNTGADFSDVNHQMGFSDGTEFGEGAVLPGVSSTPTWAARLIEAKRTGGALDNAYVAALEAVFKKQSNTGGINDKRCTIVGAQVYDNTGRTPLTDAPQTVTPSTAALVLTGYAPTVTVAAGAATFVPRVMVY